MPSHPREMIAMAERRFPVRIRLRVPPGGFGQRHTNITAWLDENCGADGWAITPSGVRGVLNDAVSIYFLDATLAGAFVARWCVGSTVETKDGVFCIRDDEPAPRIGAATSSNTLTLEEIEFVSLRACGDDGQAEGLARWYPHSDAANGLSAYSMNASSPARIAFRSALRPSMATSCRRGLPCRPSAWRDRCRTADPRGGRHRVPLRR